MKKGPQTIEKAKQGAYVARTISSLQKIKLSDGQTFGVIDKSQGNLVFKPYVDFLQEIISSVDIALLRDFTLSAGVVSNHGNWFTSEDHNKELKVLAQSYDWLLFLTDSGLAEFIETLLLGVGKRYKPIKDSFIQSYSGEKGKNQFTKTRISLNADRALIDYFRKNLSSIESWFNIISPNGKSIQELKNELSTLKSKDWPEILK